MWGPYMEPTGSLRMFRKANASHAYVLLYYDTSTWKEVENPRPNSVRFVCYHANFRGVLGCCCSSNGAIVGNIAAGSVAPQAATSSALDTLKHHTTVKHTKSWDARTVTICKLPRTPWRIAAAHEACLHTIFGIQCCNHCCPHAAIELHFKLQRTIMPHR
jgi:hypothetical protein